MGSVRGRKKGESLSSYLHCETLEKGILSRAVPSRWSCPEKGERKLPIPSFYEGKTTESDFREASERKGPRTTHLYSRQGEERLRAYTCAQEEKEEEDPCRYLEEKSARKGKSVVHLGEERGKLRQSSTCPRSRKRVKRPERTIA